MELEERQEMNEVLIELKGSIFFRAAQLQKVLHGASSAV